MARTEQTGAASWALAVVAALSLIAALVYFFLPEDGINGSLGAGIVIGSTMLMLLAQLAIAYRLARGALRALLSFLILLDILGTGLAAYMLEADALTGLMVVALLCWLASLGQPRAPARVEAVS